MKLKYISWIPAVVLMGIIFYFSSKPANDSNQGSLAIVDVVMNMYEKITHVTYQQGERTELINLLNHFIRKLAHFCEYAILSGAIGFHLSVLKKKGKWLFFIPSILAALYSVTDEFHQTFVPGRSGQIRDVLIDTSGAVAGALLFMLAFALFSKRRKKKAANQLN